ncbi:MAG TPA: MotA/TolQ/ExbB proton channel family protein [Allosphingosinicella sp.]
MDVRHVVDPVALLLVWGGATLAGAVRSTREDIGRAVGALRPAFRANPTADALAARRAVRKIEHIADYKGLACADHVDAASPFVRRAALRLVDADSADAFARWARQELEDREARHEAAIAVWRSIADAAPAMGMIGTILGLAGLFTAMDDPAKMGPAMAMAVLTTLYGLILAACIANPLAARLERLSAAELRWQKAALARLEQLARGEPLTTSAWLKQRAGA